MKNKTTTRKPATKKAVKRAVTKAPKKTNGKNTKKTTCTTSKNKTAPKKPNLKASTKNTARKTDSKPTTKSKKSEKKNSEDIVVVIKDYQDNKKGHPHIIIETFDDKHVSVGLTSSKFKGKNSPNKALKKNPLGRKDPGYMRRQGTVDFEKKYTNKRQGFMDKTDHSKAVEYGKKAKEKYLK